MKGRAIAMWAAGAAMLAGCGAQVPAAGDVRTVLQTEGKPAETTPAAPRLAEPAAPKQAETGAPSPVTPRQEDQTVALTIHLGSSVNPMTATLMTPAQRARATKIRERTENLGRANWLALLASMHQAIRGMTVEELIKQSKAWSRDPDALLTFVDTHLTKAEALSPKEAQASSAVFSDDDFKFTYELTFGTRRPVAAADAD